MGTRDKLIRVADNPELERAREQLYDSFCRHLVCLGDRYSRLDGQGRPNDRVHLEYFTFFVARGMH